MPLHFPRVSASKRYRYGAHLLDGGPSGMDITLTEEQSRGGPPRCGGSGDTCGETRADSHPGTLALVCNSCGCPRRVPHAKC